MNELRNVFACLVHEERACVLDLVRNLHYLDPGSLVLVYNGGQDPALVSGTDFSFERYSAVVHPASRPLRWGTLHEFAIESMRFAAQLGRFDALTIVDSDQLALRAGYSKALQAHLATRPRVGLLGSEPASPPGRPRMTPSTGSALRERSLWRPFLREFADGETKFGQWTFWPSTIFTAEACRAIVSLWDRNETLRTIMAQSKIWATEEVVLPTLAALLGFEIEASPFRCGYVRFRERYGEAQLERAFANPLAYWMHPVQRNYHDRVRTNVRAHFDHYGEPSIMAPSAPAPRARPFSGPPR